MYFRNRKDCAKDCRWWRIEHSPWVFYLIIWATLTEVHKMEGEAGFKEKEQRHWKQTSACGEKAKRESSGCFYKGLWLRPGDKHFAVINIWTVVRDTRVNIEPNFGWLNKKGGASKGNHPSKGEKYQESIYYWRSQWKNRVFQGCSSRLSHVLLNKK